MTKAGKHEFTLSSINSYLATSKEIIKSLQQLYKETSAEQNDMSDEMKEKLKNGLQQIENQKHSLFRYVHWLNLSNQQYSTSRSIYIHEVINNAEQIGLLYDELKKECDSKCVT